MNETAVRRASASAARLLAALCAAFIASAAQAQDDWHFEDVDRVVAVSDIHGAYDAFVRILQRAGVVDDGLAWQGGETHLVIVGDVVDRGPESRRALDLIRKLEQEAPAAGGAVHMVLGNHEIMNMLGDLRYVSAAEYAAFADEEPADVRAAELERYVASFDDDADAARAMFDSTYPPGFFAHRAAFSAAGEYGAWLLDKPVLLVVDDFAFVHGGLAEGVIAESSNLNAHFAAEIEQQLDAQATLFSGGLVSRTVDVYDLPSAASALLETAERDQVTLAADAEAAAKALAGADFLESFAPDGPVWYRGNVGCNRLTEQDRLSRALGVLGVRHLVVGHTPSRGLVLSRMDERLLRVDAGMLAEFYGGRAAALVIESGRIQAIYEDEAESSAPLEQPRRVGVRPANLLVDDLEAVLKRATVSDTRALSDSISIVRLEDGDLELLGLFIPAGRDGMNPAVAAYRLDRIIGLDMVPVTVAREIDGVMGALQFFPQSSITETERRESQQGASAWCPLSDQFKDMYLFDSLIYNEARSADRMRYSTDDFELLLIANNVTFSTARDRPAYLSEVPVELTPAWRAALESLDEDSLTAALGDVLDRRRIRALLARRDNLIELPR